MPGTCSDRLQVFNIPSGAAHRSWRGLMQYHRCGGNADAVPREAEHRTLEAVLAHAGGDVRVVVLHGDRTHAGPRQRVARREVLGVEIVPDSLGVFGLVEMVVFIATVFIAYAYVWRRGGLDWD